MLIRRNVKAKLSRRAERAVFLDVSPAKKSWVFLLWDSRKVIESRNAYMFEDVFAFKENDKDNSNLDLRATIGLAAIDMADDEREVENEDIIAAQGGDDCVV